MIGLTMSKSHKLLKIRSMSDNETTPFLNYKYEGKHMPV